MSTYFYFQSDALPSKAQNRLLAHGCLIYFLGISLNSRKAIKAYEERIRQVKLCEAEEEMAQAPFGGSTRTITWMTASNWEKGGPNVYFPSLTPPVALRDR